MFDKNKVYLSFIKELKVLINNNIEDIEPEDYVKIVCNQFDFSVDFENLYKIYMEELSSILEKHSSISTIEPLMMIGLIHSILEKNKNLIIQNNT